MSLAVNDLADIEIVGILYLRIGADQIPGPILGTQVLGRQIVKCVSGANTGSS